MLIFEESPHTYRWNGIIVPNVTKVLAPLTDYSMIAPDKLRIAQEKGNAVHQYVEMHSKGMTEEYTWPDWMMPVMQEWERFVVDAKFKLLESEYQMYHGLYKYAGTVDLVGIMHGEKVIIDIKRSFLAGGVIGLQLAAYLDLYAYKNQTWSSGVKRYALKLNETGPYKVEEFKDKSDFNEFLACLAFWRVKEKHT